MSGVFARRRRSAGFVLGADVRDASSVAEAMRMAGIDYEVGLKALQEVTVLDDNGVLRTSLPGHRLLYRKDTGAGLGVARSRYQPVQTGRLFDVADNLRAAGARFESAGESAMGRPFMTMSLGDARSGVTQVDEVVTWLLFRADHTGDGGSAFLSLRAERTVCTNGMTVSIPGLATEFKIPHTASGEERLEEARMAMAEAVRYAKAYEAIGQQLVAVPMSRGEFTAWIDGLFPSPGEDAAPAKRTRWLNRRAELLGLFDRAETQEEGRGTRWAAFNAVTEWLSWSQPVRGGDSPEVARAARELEDRSRELRDRALRGLMPVSR